MVLFFLSCTDTHEEYMGNIQAVFLANMVYGTIVRIYNHILLPSHFIYIALGMIGVLIGLSVANKIIGRLNGERIKTFTYIVIGFSGVMNLIQG